jgi:hypothetical protein
MANLIRSSVIINNVQHNHYSVARPRRRSPNQFKNRGNQLDFGEMARSAGVEPTTFGFGNQHSIQLSYERNQRIITK